MSARSALQVVDHARGLFGWTCLEIARALSSDETTVHRWRRGTKSPSPVFATGLEALRGLLATLSRAYPDVNLLSNAVKVTPSGGRVVVSTPVRTEGGYDAPSTNTVFLRVADTGCGIAQEKQDAIFDPSVQVHRSRTRATEGTGLGLAISRDLARGMGGELRVWSEVGRGPTFRLSLPRSAERLPEFPKELASD